MSNAGQDTETVFLGLTLKHSKVHTIGESICNVYEQCRTRYRNCLFRPDLKTQ